jgi:hypothetical protein
MAVLKHTPIHARYLTVLHEFNETFGLPDAHAFLHKMARAAFARTDVLTKETYWTWYILKTSY